MKTLETIQAATPKAFAFVLDRIRSLFSEDLDMSATIPWIDLGLEETPEKWTPEGWEALGDFLDELISARSERIFNDDGHGIT